VAFDGKGNPIHGAAATTPDEAARAEATWQGPLVAFGLALGVLLMGLQLWLLTLAFNLYLSGERESVVIAAVISGLVFLGGIGMLQLLDRAPARRRAGRAPTGRHNA
jgi:hypothetical protein